MILVIFILIIIIIYQARLLYKNRAISQELSISIILYLLFWNIYPILYSFCKAKANTYYFYKDTYQTLIFYNLLTIIVILFLLNKYAKSAIYFNKNKINLKLKYIIIFLFLGVLSIFFENLYYIKISGITFLDRINYVVSESNIINSSFSFLGGLANFIPPFAIACLFSKNEQIYENKIIRYLSIIIIIIYTGFMVIAGARALLILPVILLFFYKRIFKNLNKINTALIIVIMLSITIIYSIHIGNIRLAKSYTINDILNAGPLLRESSLKEIISSVCEGLFTKFNAFEHGANLIEYEGYSRAGTKLIVSSLMSPIPRILYPSKPVPFSINGEYSGIPYYLVPKIEGYEGQMNVVPVPPSIISLWELGTLGLLLMILFNLIWLLLINKWLKSDSLVYRTFAFYMLSLPTFEFLIAPVGWIIKEGLRILILIYLFKFIILLKEKKADI